MNYIELFAGCGGLSLGLQSVGFQLTIANELSPMAAETYAFNLLNEDLRLHKQIKKTLWLESAHPKSEIALRLRENLAELQSLEIFSDVESNGENLNGALVIGSITKLNELIESNKRILRKLKGAFESSSVDLISGGPPCQSFSMAGLRQKDSEKNILPWEFAKFAKAIQPKFVLIENVSGILRPFKSSDGSLYYAWLELSKVIAQSGFVPICLHVNAKYVGVPQNRPRFILLGVRADIFLKLSRTFNENEVDLCKSSFQFFEKIQINKLDSTDILKCHDLSTNKNHELFQKTFLKYLISPASFVSVKDAIDDLKGDVFNQGYYAKSLNEKFRHVLKKKKLENHELRKNSDHVKRRFRIYQVLETLPQSISRDVLRVLKGVSFDIKKDSWHALKDEFFLNTAGQFARFKDKHQFTEFLVLHTTKKHSQRALKSSEPARAALSIPDDVCHYDSNVLRTLSVREMARIQSFPDNFAFKSKVTTGGKQRRFEVPQYTQVGNAVPPLLARALGLIIKNLLIRDSCSK